MQMTLLEMVQSVMSAMESDKVNSIDDTSESQDIAIAVKEAYFDLLAQRDWPFICQLTNLTGLADTDNPTKMLIPDGVNKIFWIRYNKKAVTWMSPQDFKEMIDKRTVSAGVTDANGYNLTRDPLYWTTYDDKYVHFDSYDSDTENTLTTAKGVIYGTIVPTWTHADSFTPLLPDKMFPTLLADVKGTCFLNMKQQANAKEESKAHKGKIRFQNEAWRANAGENGYGGNINYGRK